MKVVLKSSSGSVKGETEIAETQSISQLKDLICSSKVLKIARHRLALKSAARGGLLGDSTALSTLSSDGGEMELYFKDLGPQVAWKTVFLMEYFGPFAVYLAVYARPYFIYGAARHSPVTWEAKVAMYCWSVHYLKRIFETLFVHRFSKATMPIGNLYKNCIYYWGCAAYIAYYVCHPLYTPPSRTMFLIGLGVFGFGELGNLSIHLALRGLRSSGGNERKIPMPTANPFTLLFHAVSCPNYTYEVISWLGFSLMTHSIPAMLFTLCGAYQMFVWGRGKHRNYKKEFPSYPRNRTAVVPFIY